MTKKSPPPGDRLVTVCPIVVNGYGQKIGRTAGFLGIPDVRKPNVGRHTPPHSSR